MQVFNFFNIDSRGQVIKGSAAYFIDEEDKYYPGFAKVDYGFVGIHMSPIMKNFHHIGGSHHAIEARLYKKEGEFIPIVDEFILRDKNGCYELYYKIRNDSFQIKYLDYIPEKDYIEEYQGYENIKHILKSLNLRYETSDFSYSDIQTLRRIRDSYTFDAHV